MHLCIRRLYILCAILFISGIASGITDAGNLALVAEVSIVATIAVSTTRNKKAACKNTALLVTVFLSAFNYGLWRNENSQSNQLENFNGRSIVLTGALVKSFPSTNPNANNFMFKADHILFPKRQSLDLEIFLNVNRRANSETPKLEEFLNAPVQITALIKKSLSPSPTRKSSFAAFCTDADLKLLRTIKTTQTDKHSLLANFVDTKNIESILDQLRSNIVQSHARALNQERGCLLSSIVLGDKAVKLPAQIVNDFRSVGLSHILAASGFNLTLIITGVYFIAGGAITGDNKRGILALLVIVIYILLTGLSASIVRAAIMCSFVIVSRMIRRQAHLMATMVTALALTAAVDPVVLTDLGLQLSYAATLGITLGAKRLSEVLQCVPNRVGQMFAEAVAVCTMAQLSVLPIQAYAFCSANMLFLPSNLMVLPLVAPLTVLGFITTLISVLSMLPLPTRACTSELASTLDSFMALPLDYMLTVSHSLAGISWTKVFFMQPIAAQIIAYYLLLALAIVGLHRGWPRMMALTLMLSATTILLTTFSGPALSIGIFANETVLVNQYHKAISIDCHRAQEERDNSMPDTSAAHMENHNSARERFLSLHGISKTQLASEITATGNTTLNRINETLVYVDRSKHVAVLTLQREQELRQALNQQFVILGMLTGTSERFLLVRFDEFSNLSQGKQLFEELVRAHSLMASSAVEQGIFVYNHKQYKRLRYFIYALSKFRATTDATVEITSQPNLTVVKFSRELLEKLAKHNKGD